MNTLSWKEVYAFDHGMDTLDDNNTHTDLNIYVESETKEDGPLYEAVSKPFALQKLTNQEIAQFPRDSELPRVGISKISVSHDSNYAATICETCPLYVWIWDLSNIQLNSIIMQKKHVDDIEWAPNSLNLNISSSDGKIFLWSLRGASVC